MIVCYFIFNFQWVLQESSLAKCSHKADGAFPRSGRLNFEDKEGHHHGQISMLNFSQLKVLKLFLGRMLNQEEQNTHLGTVFSQGPFVILALSFSERGGYGWWLLHLSVWGFNLSSHLLLLLSQWFHHSSFWKRCIYISVESIRMIYLQCVII